MATNSTQVFDQFSMRILDEADVHLSLTKNAHSNSNASGGNFKNLSHGGGNHARRNRGASSSFSTSTSAPRCVTAFQLADYLKRFESSAMPLSSTIHRLGAELSSTRNLSSSHADSVIKELLRFRDGLEGERPSLPPPSALKAISLILLNPVQYHSEILQSVGEWGRKKTCTRACIK